MKEGLFLPLRSRAEGIRALAAQRQSMSVHNRHFVKLLDYSPTELQQLVRSALSLKSLHSTGHQRAVLTGRSLASLYHENCTQTRWTFGAACSKLGVLQEYFSGEECALGSRESVAVSATLLGRLYESIALCAAPQEKVEEFARLCGRPVLNLGNSTFCPLVALADLATLSEHSSKSLDELSVTLVGDGRSAYSQSMMVAAAKLGIDFRLAGPKDLHPEETLLETCLALAAETNGQIRIFTELEESLTGTDFVCTQSWLDGHTDAEARIKSLLAYRIDSQTVSTSGNHQCKVLHRLPVLLGDESPEAAELLEQFGLDGLELSRELFDSNVSLCFEQSENLLYAHQAVLVNLFS